MTFRHYVSIITWLKCYTVSGYTDCSTQFKEILPSSARVSRARRSLAVEVVDSMVFHLFLMNPDDTALTWTRNFRVCRGSHWILESKVITHFRVAPPGPWMLQIGTKNKVSLLGGVLRSHVFLLSKHLQINKMIF